MADRSPAQVFPRRDADGRIISLSELLVAALGGSLIGLAVLCVIDGVLELISPGSFGHASGWLTAILPAFMFFDDFRGWRGTWLRLLVAALGAGLGLGLGLTVAGLTHGLPPLFSGAIGAAVAVLAYSVIWFLGIRWLTGNLDLE